MSEPSAPVLEAEKPLTPPVPDKRSVPKSSLFPWFIVLGILVLLLVIFSPFSIVSAGSRGVVTYFGDVQSDALAPGFHLKYPLERVHLMNTRTQKVEITSDTITKEGLEVNLTVAVNYHLDSERVVIIYTDVGFEYEDVFIRPIVEDVLKTIVARYPAKELLAKRSDLVVALRTDVENRLFEKNIVVEDLAIVNFAFSDEYTKAQEERELAAVRAETAAQDLESVKIESKITSAEASTEAERIRTIGKALEGNEIYVQWELVSKWDGESPLSLPPM